MPQLSVPYGSQQSSFDHGYGMVLPWVERLTLQSAELNVEHRELLQKLNTLLLTLDSGDTMRITMACDVLSAEVQLHFAKERELMLAADYPDSATHIEQHEELMRALAGFRFALTSTIGVWSPVDAESMLEQWFVPHLTHADRRLAEFMAARGDTPDAA